jgi:hypothetical protein
VTGGRDSRSGWLFKIATNVSLDMARRRKRRAFPLEDGRRLDTLVSMLTDDATWSMPPLPSWFGGREAIAAFHVSSVMPERWRHVSPSPTVSSPSAGTSSTRTEGAMSARPST